MLSAPSPLDEGLLSTIEKTSEEFWRGVPVVPVMSAAGSDGTYLRNAGIPLTCPVAKLVSLGPGADERDYSINLDAFNLSGARIEDGVGDLA